MRRKLIISKDEDEPIYCKSLEEAMKKNPYIGIFNEHTESKYFLIELPSGLCCVRIGGCLSVTESSIYYVFDSKNELLEWMKGE